MRELGIVSIERATVYRSGNRRFLSKRAAMSHAAHELAQSRSGCDEACKGFHRSDADYCEWWNFDIDTRHAKAREVMWEIKVVREEVPA